MRRAITTTSAGMSAWAPPASSAAARRRRLIRLRSTAWPTRFVTVKPTRRPALSPSRTRPCTVIRSVWKRRPLAAARKSARLVSRSIASGRGPRTAANGLSRQTLPAARPAGGDDAASAFGRHAGPEAVPTLADDLAGLIGPLHGLVSIVRAGRVDAPCRYGPESVDALKRGQRPEGAVMLGG